MKKIYTSLILLLAATFSFSQTRKIELFEMVKKFVQDSTGSDSFGDWDVGDPSAYPVHWQPYQVQMSDDIKINFFMTGTVTVSINGNLATKWNIMLKGPRSGFSSFNMSATDNKNIKPGETIDSLFGKKQYVYKLIQSCNASPEAGYHYYQLKIPKKVTAFLKISWACKNAACVLNLDCYDEWSKQYADLACPGK